jgi:hypothetical protein
MAEAILAQRLSLQAGLTQARNSALLAGMESQPKKHEEDVPLSPGRLQGK